MNKKEISEIKKNFSEDNPFLTMNRAVVTVIDADSNIRAQQYFSPVTMSGRESTILWETLRKIISTKLNKNLIQHYFTDDAYTDGTHELLMNLKEYAFDYDKHVDAFIKHNIDTYPMDVPYALIIAPCTYAIPHKTKADEVDENSSTEVFNFVVVAKCPVTISGTGFMFDNHTDSFSTEADERLYISHDPADGFIFPAFDNRSANVNSLMYYTKSGDISFWVDDALGCTPLRSYKTEKSLFHTLLKSLFGEDLTYNLIYAINESVSEYLELNRYESDPVMVGVEELEEIFGAVVDPEILEKLPALYTKIIGNDEVMVGKLHASNLVENSIKLKANGCTITVGKSHGDLLGTSVLEGAKSINYKLADPVITINDVSVNL